MIQNFKVITVGEKRILGADWSIVDPAPLRLTEIWPDGVQDAKGNQYKSEQELADYVFETLVPKYYTTGLKYPKTILAVSGKVTEDADEAVKALAAALQIENEQYPGAVVLAWNIAYDALIDWAVSFGKTSAEDPRKYFAEQLETNLPEEGRYNTLVDLVLAAQAVEEHGLDKKEEVELLQVVFGFDDPYAPATEAAPTDKTEEVPATEEQPSAKTEEPGTEAAATPVEGTIPETSTDDDDEVVLSKKDLNGIYHMLVGQAQLTKGILEIYEDKVAKRAALPQPAAQTPVLEPGE